MSVSFWQNIEATRPVTIAKAHVCARQPVMFGLANAISLARATALGQCGQVGVENTWMVVGVVTASTRARFSGVSWDSYPPASISACTSEMNS